MHAPNQIKSIIADALARLRLPADRIDDQLPGRLLPPGGPSGNGYPAQPGSVDFNDITGTINPQQFPIAGFDSSIITSGQIPRSPLTSRGDLLASLAAGIHYLLPIGPAGMYLRSDGTDPYWSGLSYADLLQGSATTGQALTWNGTAWVPQTPSGGSVGTGQIAYGGMGGVLTSESTLSWDATNKRLGLNIAAPLAQLHLVDESAGSPTRGLIIGQHTNHPGAASAFFRRSRGTLASPTSVANGDYVGVFNTHVYAGSAYIEEPAYFGFAVAGTVSSGNAPVDIVFHTLASGSAWLLGPRMTIKSGGAVWIGSPSSPLTAAGALDVAGVVRGTSFQVGANQVVGARGAAVADASATVASVQAQLNALLARLRASTGHGLIAG